MPINDIAPTILGCMVFIIPIVAILTSHQRKMAELIHRSREPQLSAQNDMLMMQEIARLREMVSQQTLALDSLARSQQILESRLAQSDTLTERLEA